VNVTFATTAFLASGEIKLCHVSSSIDAVLPSANDLDTRFGGFLEAVKKYNDELTKTKQSNVKKIEKAVFEYLSPEGSNIDIPSLIERAHKQGCFAVVGLISSKDALLAAPFLKKYKMAAVSSTAVSNDLDAYFPHILSLSSSAESWSREIVNQIKTHKADKTVVLFDSSDVYSYNLLSKLKLEWQRNIKLKIPALETVETKNVLAVKNISPGSNSQKLAVVFTTYPMASLSALKLMNGLTKSNNLRLFGNPAWMETHAFSADGDLFQKLPDVFLVAPWFLTDENKLFTDFKKRYQISYKKNPDHDSSYDYDAATLLLRCASSKKSALECITNLKSFSGVSGNYAFSGKSHSERPERAQKADFSGTVR
jgi:ABC-type branched-subunit amino acid transport system substrate-binding protein